MNSQNPKSAIERLHQQDRIITQTVILPKNMPLTDDQIAKVLQAFKDYTSTPDNARVNHLKHIAMELEYSPRVLAAWVRGKYTGNIDKVTHMVNDWLEQKLRRDQACGPCDYVPTWIAEEMQSVVRLADRHQKMAAIVAPSGSGKDMVIKVLGEQLNARTVECCELMTPRQFLIALGEAIGLQSIRGASIEIINRIVKRLNNHSCLIFLNEAQQLRKPCASVIRTIYDQTGVSIIMFGSDDIFDFIDDRAFSGGNKRASSGGQFWRRCIKFNVTRRCRVVPNPSNPNQMGRPLFTLDEVRNVLSMKQVKLHRDTLSLVWRIACLQDHGTLGLALGVVGYAADLWPSEPLTRDMILEALELAQDSEAQSIRCKIEQAEVSDKASTAYGDSGVAVRAG